MRLELIIFFIIILVIGGMVFGVVALRSRGSSILNLEKYRTAWLKIDQSIVRDNEASMHLAILNADKLLDRALRERGFSGQTMGERMKAASSSWDNENHIWAAHKIRNRIAHESEISVSYDTTRRALAAYKQGLKDMGAI